MRLDRQSYNQFVRSKTAVAEQIGYPCTPEEAHEALKPHQRVMVAWAVRGGRRALFASFGLGKSLMQIEVCRLTLAKSGGTRALIVAPLGVRQEFIEDASIIGATVEFIRSADETLPPGIYITNYETVRDGKLDPTLFDVVSLDEASCLRGFGGTKTFREFMAILAGDDRRDRSNRIKRDGVRHRFVATATPSPNEFIELLAYSAFLGVMDVGQAKTRFFKRDSTKADHLTIHPHKEREFWLWVSSWALFVQKPSDLGFSDEGYDLPELDVRWHEVASDHTPREGGRAALFHDASLGIVQASREKRDNIGARIAKLLELREESPDAHRLIWHDLEAERHAIERAIPGITTVYGSQDLEAREDLIQGFSHGKIRELAAKPVMCGSGCNFQRHCSHAIFLGIGFKFNDFIQAIHRLHRFLQTNRVRIDLIYSEAEWKTRETLERKWAQHKQLVHNMSEIIKEYGLASSALADEMTRKTGVERSEALGENWRAINNDSVLETDAMPDDSVGFIVSSIPFGTQYEYSANYADFGHTDTNEHFWAQMDFLTPSLLRVLQPGRVAAIHVKDRIVPGGLAGVGFQTVQPFHAECIAHFTKHGFHYMGMITIVTDVVRENAQTYRLGWTEQCKDGTKMGVGMPEYLLLFRKAPTDNTNGYADDPVVKDKADYTRGRWQFDAHGMHRSSGDRPIGIHDFDGLTHAEIYQLFKKMSLGTVHDHERDVSIAEYLDAKGKLPPSFMLLQPQSWIDDVWTDVVRMRTLNTVQVAAKREQHICPLPFDIVDRAITRFSMPGEIVYDPFAGLMTVPLCAMKLGRVGVGCELATEYWADGVWHLKRASEGAKQLSLMDFGEVA